MTLPSGAGDTPPDFAKTRESLERLRRESDDWWRVSNTLSWAESSLVALTARAERAEAENAALRQEGLERDVDILSKDIK